MSLLTRAGHFGDDGPPSPPGWRLPPTADALRALTESPKDEIPNSVRIAVLYDLAREGFPDRDSARDEYLGLAHSVTDGRDVDPDQLLNDLQEASGKQAPFHTTATGQALDPHEVAFVGESVCRVQRVRVGELTGTWIYSEFDTDAPFESVSEWVDPRNWPRLAPFMFKGMNVVGAPRPLAITGQGTDHWHGVFHEEVQLFNRISALLHCDHWRDGDRAAGMTFELDFSPDGQTGRRPWVHPVTNIRLENGDPACRVQALKIVGFTADIWDRFAERVCPWWTDFLRGAVRDSSSAPKPTEPASPPESLHPEDLITAWTSLLRRRRPGRTSTSSRTSTREPLPARTRPPTGWPTGPASGPGSRRTGCRLGHTAWRSFPSSPVTPAGRESICVRRRRRRRPRRPQQARRPQRAPPPADSGARQATTPPASAPPGSPAAAAPALDDLVFSVPGLGEGERPVGSDLVSIEAGARTIAARDVSVTVVTSRTARVAVRLRTSGTSAVLRACTWARCCATAGGPRPRPGPALRLRARSGA